MKCALASMGFINGDLRHNKQVILDTMTAYSGKADVVIFGEAFLQGFYAAAFDAAHDTQFDENVKEIKQLRPDAVFWPVYTDFNSNEWNNTIKHEYAAQANRFCKTVLYVNSYCKDKLGSDFAKGGAALFQDGTIRAEIPSGKEGVLLVDI